MNIIGCALHTRYQEIALLDTATGEVVTARAGETASRYIDLGLPIGVCVITPGRARAESGARRPAMRHLVIRLIKMAQKGKIIKTRGVYSGIYSELPDECERLGFTPTKPIEEKWRKEIRFGLQDAKNQGLIEHVGSPKSGTWRRI